MLIQFIPSIIKGSQKWKGAAPIFIIKASINILEVIVKFCWDIFKTKVLIRIDNRKIIEAKDWEIK